MSRKKKSKMFRNSLIIYSSLLAIVIIVVYVLLWIKMSNYQENVDNEAKAQEYAQEVKRAPQLFFEDYYKKMSSDDWVSIWYDNYPERFDSEDVVKTFVQDTFMGDDISLWKDPAYTTDTPIYLLKKNDENLARFYLSGRELDWKIDRVESLAKGPNAVTVSVPANCTLYLNDVSVDDKFLIDESQVSDPVTADATGYNDSLINPVSYKTYTVDCLLSEPVVTASSNREGYLCGQDIHEQYYEALPAEDAASYQQKALGFVKALLHYYNDGGNNTGGNMNAALSYIAPSSVARNVIQQSYDGVKWRQTLNVAYETTASDAYILSDNCIAVDISYISHKAAEAGEKGDVYRVFFLDIGKGYGIYNFGLQ